MIADILSCPVLLQEKIISDNITLISGTHPFGIDVSSILVSSGKEVIVFDTLFYPQETVALIQKIKDKQMHVSALVNTHWHTDHTIGNELFGRRIISQSKCGDFMKTDLPKQLKPYSGELKGATVKLPTETFEQEMHITLGDIVLDLFHLEGHTPDSMVAYIKDSQVLIAGDTVMELPFMAYGNSARLVSSLKEIEKLNVSQVIQGHGGACKVEKLREDIGYLESIQDRVRRAITSGMSIDDVVNLPIEGFLSERTAKNLHPAYKEAIHKENMRNIYKELSESQS